VPVELERGRVLAEVLHPSLIVLRVEIERLLEQLPWWRATSRTTVVVMPRMTFV
jgi:hypothetical protein